MTETRSTPMPDDDPGPNRVETLTVLAAVPDEHLADLRDRLAQLRRGPSPFAGTPSTHFARLLVLPGTETGFPTQRRPTGMGWGGRLTDLVFHAGRAQHPDVPDHSYLLFEADYDVQVRPGAGPGATGADGGPAAEDRPTPGPARYLDELRLQLNDRADEVFRYCTGYPGWTDATGFATFFTSRMMPAGYVFHGVHAQPSVATVRQALTFRREVIRLALETAGRPESERAELLRARLPLLDRLASGRSGNGTGSRLGAVAPATAEPGPEELSAEQAAAAEAVAPGTVRVPMAGLPGASRATRPEPLDQHRPVQLTEPDLADVQSIVTSGYRRHQAARHLLLRVSDRDRARAWLRRVADVVPTADWAQPRVHRMKGSPGPAARPSGPGDPGGRYPDLAVHVALSFHGLAELGLPRTQLDGFPLEFRAGMAGREAALAPGQGTAAWTGPFAVEARTGPDGVAEPVLRTPVDVLVIMAAADRETLDAELAGRPWLEAGAQHGLEVLAGFDGGRIRADAVTTATGDPGFVEHFGFLDGVSQPRVHGVTVGPVTTEPAELPAGEVLLGYRDVDGDTAGRTIDPDLARHGSFLVYRKLRQDVAAFRRLSAELGRRLESEHAVPPGTDPTRLAAAKLLGRWPDGTPLTLRPSAGAALDPQLPFGYQETDFDGRHCPVGAHIRRANPRDSRPVDPTQRPSEGGRPGIEQRLTQRHRMLRRGIPYGPPLADPAPDPASGQDVPEGDGDRGLLFLAFVGDLQRQFEFVQANWLSDGNAMRLGADRDLFSGACPAGSKFTAQGDRPTFLELDEHRLVTCLGGEYFFLPGIKALRLIAGTT